MQKKYLYIVKSSPEIKAKGSSLAISSCLSHFAFDYRLTNYNELSNNNIYTFI